MKSYLSLFLATVFVGAANAKEGNIRGLKLKGRGPENAPDGTDGRAGGVTTYAGCLYDCVATESDILGDGTFTCAEFCKDENSGEVDEVCLKNCVKDVVTSGSIAGFCAKFQIEEDYCDKPCRGNNC